MEKLFKRIKSDDSFKYFFFYFCLGLSLLMIISAFLCLVTYTNVCNYELLLASKELLSGAFGVFVIGFASFFILNDIIKKFKE